MNTLNDMEFAFITDERYAMPTCVAIISLICNIKREMKAGITILCDKVTEDSKKKLRSIATENAHITLLDVDSTPYRMFAENVMILKSAVLKFFLPEILKDKDKVLYLDSDILVNGDISLLFDVSVEKYYVAAAEDLGDRHMEDGQSFYGKCVGLVGPLYFNSGVLLMNLKKMREDHIIQKLVEYKENNKTRFVDQDAFNVVLREGRRILPQKFNFMSLVFETEKYEDVIKKYCEYNYPDMESCINGQIVLHFASQYKPWKWYMPFFTEKFVKYYEISPYRGEKLVLDMPLRQALEENSILKDYITKLEEQKKCFISRRQLMEWRFPKEKIPKDCRLVLYGAGEVGNNFAEKINENKHCELVLWVDKYKGNVLDDVQLPCEITSREYDCVLVAIAKEEHIESAKNELISLGIPQEKIVTLQ